MLRVTVRLGGGIGSLKQIQEKEITVCSGTTVAGLLEQLGKEFGNERLEPTMLVVVNNKSVPEKDRKDWTLQEGDVISVVRSFAGG